MISRLNSKWAAKLLRSKSFIVMTDTESAIVFKGVNPSSFTDVLALRAQAVELDHYIDSLKKLKVEHDKAADELLGGLVQKGGPKKVTRIKVK